MVRNGRSESGRRGNQQDVSQDVGSRKRDQLEAMDIDDTEKRQKLVGIFQAVFQHRIISVNSAEQGCREQ